MTKRLFALLLALAMVATVFYGCDSSNSGNSGNSSSKTVSTPESKTDSTPESKPAGTGDLPTISLAIECLSTPADLQMVQEELCKLTAPEGFNVELLAFEVANSAQQINLLLSGGDDTLDVFGCDGGGMSVNFNNAASNGQLMDIGELLAPYADEMKEALGEEVFNAGIINGVQYGVGRLLDQASTPCVTLTLEVAEKYGYKNGDATDLAGLTELFKKIRADYPDVPIIGPNNGKVNLGDARFDTLGDANFLGVLPDYGQSETVVNYYETDEYKELVSYFKQWKEMGVYMTDFMNVTDSPVDYITANKALGCFAGHFSAEMNGIWSSDNFGVDCASISIYDSATAVTPGAYYSVNANCKNPEAAAKLLYMMATNSEVENLLINGVEGVHHKVLEDGSVTYADGVDTTNCGWSMGYSWWALNSSVSKPFNYPADYYDKMKAANASAQRSKAFGCQFDMTSVTDAVSACTNVVGQYREALASGSVDDFDGTLAQFQQALKDAGIDEIITAKQAQLDAFLGK